MRMLEVCESLEENENIYGVNCIMRDFRDYLVNKSRVFPVAEYEFDFEFAKFVLEKDHINGRNIGFIDGKVKYMNVNFIWRGYRNIDHKGKMGVYNELQRIVHDLNEKCDSGCNQGFLSAYDNFAWLHVREIVLSNTFQGIFFSLSLSFLVLLATTKSVSLSLMAISAIFSIIATLLSVIRLWTGEFGLVESTCVIVFIGLSFDYVVHICH